MSFGQQRCAECAHALRDPNPSPEAVILGRVTSMCLGAPPSAMAVQQPNGVVTTITIYPMVTAETYSCAAWTPRLDQMNG